MAVATMGRDDAAAGEECAGSDELPDETWREITVAEGFQGPRDSRGRGIPGAEGFQGPRDSRGRGAICSAPSGYG